MCGTCRARKGSDSRFFLSLSRKRRQERRLKDGGWWRVAAHNCRRKGFFFFFHFLGEKELKDRTEKRNRTSSTCAWRWALREGFFSSVWSCLVALPQEKAPNEEKSRAHTEAEERRNRTHFTLPSFCALEPIPSSRTAFLKCVRKQIFVVVIGYTSTHHERAEGRVFDCCP